MYYQLMSDIHKSQALKYHFMVHVVSIVPLQFLMPINQNSFILQVFAGLIFK